MTRGRVPLPTAVKARRGTLRPHRLNPSPPPTLPGAPEPPSWLGPEARAEWDRLVPQLLARGLVEVIDGGLLTSYVCAWEELVIAQREMIEQGSTTVTARGAIVAHPAVKRAQVARQQIHRFGLEFGIGPAARSRVHSSSRASPEPTNDVRVALRRRFFPLVHSGEESSA